MINVFKILTMFWGCESTDSWGKRISQTQDRVKELTGRSLVNLEPKRGQSLTVDGLILRQYSVHKLVHMHLKRSLCDENTKRVFFIL